MPETSTSAPRMSQSPPQSSSPPSRASRSDDEHTNPAAFVRQALTAESRRLAEDTRREQNGKRWGPYLAERQWATVREDYSPAGTCWDYFPFEHARSRA